MRYISSIIVFAFSSYLFGQTGPNLTLMGKISGSWENKDTLYYAPMGESFNKDSFILADENRSYIFSMPISEIEGEGIETMVFSFYPDSTSTFYTCMHKIQVGEIVRMAYDSPRGIIVTTDMMPFKDCIDVLMITVTSQERKYIGTHNVVGDTTLKSVLLENGYSAVVTYSEIHDNLMTTLIGNWQYDSQKNTITVNTGQEENPELGIIIGSVRKTYVFDIIENNGKIELKMQAVID